MKRGIVFVLAVVLLGIPMVGSAQERYPAEVLEEYYQCRERHDLDHVMELIWYHNNVEPVDASIYGLPKNDFLDRSRLTIAERVSFRDQQAKLYERGVRDVPVATNSVLAYPHHLREAYDQMYEVEGSRPDCSAILSGHGFVPSTPSEVLGNGWASDHNLTSGDSMDRGEVDIALDPGNPSREAIHFAVRCLSAFGGFRP